MSKRTIVTAIFAGGLLALGMAAPASGAKLDLLTYQIHSIYEAPNGSNVERTNPGLLAVPTPVNVDNDVTTGVAGADVLAQLTIDAGRATVRVTKLPGARAVLPLLLEAILSDPRGGSSLRVAYGYDARDATAPSVYSSTIHLLGASRVTSFGLDIETAGAGSTLGIIAEVFTEGPNGERLEPQRGRLDFTPVPTIAHFGLLQGSDLGTQQSGIDITTNVPTQARAVIEDIRADSTTRGEITIDQVPNVVSLVLTDSADGRRTWNYQASDRIDLIDLSIRETRALAIVDDFALHLEDMSLTAALVQDTATHATLTTDQPIGVVQAGTAKGRAIAYLTEDAYVHSTDAGDGESLSFRVLGLSRAEIDSQDPFLIDVDLQPGPFRVLIQEGDTDIEAWIRDLPSSIRLTFSPSQGTASWTTSAPIGSLSVKATDPAGIGGRATKLDLLLEDIPRGINVSWGEASGEAKLEATDGSIGSFSLLLTSGPDLAVDAGFDGVVLEDVPSHYALAARLNGLRLVRVTTTGAPYEVDLRKTAGPFLVRLDRGSQRARIEVLDLPDSLQATLDPAGTLNYTGSAGIGLITADISDPAGIVDRATRVALRIEDIPPALTLGYSTSDEALIDAHGGRIGELTLLLTSGPDLQVDPGFDGVVLEDVVDHFAAAVRLTGLRRISIGTAAPYELQLEKDAGPFLIRLQQGARLTNIVARDLPASMTATFNPAGSLAYTGSARIGSLEAEITDPAGVAGRATVARATILDIPQSLTVSWDSSGGAIGADAGGQTVGSLDVLLTSGPVDTIPAGEDGVKLVDTAAQYTVVARLTGLRKVEFAQGPPPSFTLNTTGGRVFTVDVQRQKPSGTARTTARIDRLPASVSARFTNATTFAYTASSGVSSITLDAFDPDGISGRAKTMRALINAAPVALDVAWGSSGTITLDAKGGTVGLIEVQLTSGPDERLDPSVDGVLLNDLTDRYVVFARMTGLKKVIAAQQPSPDITLETTANRLLKIELNQLDGGKIEYTRATLDRLPSSVRVRMTDKRIFYDASAATNSLVFDSNSGDRWNLHADIRNPVPAHVAFCAAGDGFCNGYARSSGAGSFTFDASEHTTVNVFDCVRPLNAGCVQGNADSFTLVRDWRVRHFDFDADSDDVAFEGYTYNSTNGHAAQGYLLRIDGSTGFEADIRPGYSSSNRKVEWSWWGADKDKSGSVNCAGSSFSVRVFGIWIGVTSYVC